MTKQSVRPLGLLLLFAIKRGSSHLGSRGEAYLEIYKYVNINFRHLKLSGGRQILLSGGRQIIMIIFISHPWYQWASVILYLRDNLYNFYILHLPLCSCMYGIKRDIMYWSLAAYKVKDVLYISLPFYNVNVNFFSVTNSYKTDEDYVPIT